MADDAKKTVILAIDIGATNLRTTLIDVDGFVCAKHTCSTLKKGSQEDLVNFVSRCISDLLEDLGVQESAQYEVVAIGVSVAGPLTSDGKGYTPTNTDFGPVQLVAPLKREFALPVFLLNDTKAAVYAEWKVGKGREMGVVREVRNMCYITISTGIGAGMIIDGQLALGRDGSIGQVGQIAVVSPVCFGNHDWESYAGGINIATFYTKWSTTCCTNPKAYSSAEALFAAIKTDVHVQNFMRVLKQINGQGFSNVIHAYNPALIVIGGSVAHNNWDILMSGLSKYIRQDLIEVMPEIVLSDLGDDVSCQGIALYSFDQLKT